MVASTTSVRLSKSTWPGLRYVRRRRSACASWLLIQIVFFQELGPEILWRSGKVWPTVWRKVHGSRRYRPMFGVHHPAGPIKSCCPTSDWPRILWRRSSRQAALGKSAETFFAGQFFQRSLATDVRSAHRVGPLRARSRTKFLESAMERNAIEWVVPVKAWLGWSLVARGCN